MKQSIPTSIRLSEELLDRIREEATRDKRSLSKQIEFIIESYYKISELTSK